MKKQSETEIDQIVVAHADDDAAWEEPIQVRRPTSKTVSIPADLAARATFLAQVHRMKTVEEWVTRVIQERIELEEAAYSGMRNVIAAKIG